MSNTEREILAIVATYDRQEEEGEIGTPGGLEHMGDVWKILRKWKQWIEADEACKEFGI